METQATPSNNRDCPEPARPQGIVPEIMIDLTCTAHLYYLPTFVPHFPDRHLGVFFSTLETDFEPPVCSLPGGGLTKINFLVSPPLISAFGFCQRQVAKPDLFGVPGARDSGTSVTILQMCKLRPEMLDGFPKPHRQAIWLKVKPTSQELQNLCFPSPRRTLGMARKPSIW